MDGGVTAAHASPTAAPAPPFPLPSPWATRASPLRFKSPRARAPAVTLSPPPAIPASDGTPMAPASITFRTKG